jgi:hypothetical protein
MVDVIVDVGFKDGLSSDDLEPGKNDAWNVNVGDQHVARHLVDAL